MNNSAEKIKAFASQLKHDQSDIVFNPKKFKEQHKYLCDMVTQMAEALEYYNNPKYLISQCKGYCPEISDYAGFTLTKLAEGINEQK